MGGSPFGTGHSPGNVFGAPMSMLGLPPMLPTKSYGSPAPGGSPTAPSSAQASPLAGAQYGQQVTASQAFAASLHASASQQEQRDRELEQLRRDLRKANEKSNFFRSQVIALQQQVSSLGAPVMGASAAAAAAAEATRLRAELAEERAERQAAEAQLSEFQALSSGMDATSFAAAAALQSKLRVCEAELGGAAERLEAQNAEIAGLQRELAAAQRELRQPRQAPTPPPPPHGATSAYPSHSSASGRASTGSFPAGVVGTTYGQLPPRSQSALAPVSFAAPGAAWLDPVQQPGGPSRAVIVGCDYPGKVGTLRAGVADAQQWARFFTKRCGLSEHDIRLLSDDQSLFSQKAQPESAIATRDNVMRALQWLTAHSDPGEQLFFVFCGHGAQLVVEEYAGQRLCEAAIVPADACDTWDPSRPRVISDFEVHRALLQVPEGAQATLVYDCCHAGRPLDRSGLDFLSEYVSRGRVDYDKLRGHPVLPRFLELQQWKTLPMSVKSAGESRLRCRAAQWAACANAQFCVELPIDDRPRGVFTYMFISALLKAGPQATSAQVLGEARQLTSELKGRWRLQQDVQLCFSSMSSDSQPFLRL